MLIFLFAGAGAMYFGSNMYFEGKKDITEANKDYKDSLKNGGIASFIIGCACFFGYLIYFVLGGDSE